MMDSIFDAMNEKGDDELLKQAKEFFFRMKRVSSDKDVEKTAYCWYSIIKHTYSLAEGQGILEQDREQIEKTLRSMQKIMHIMFMSHDWDSDMISQFDDKIAGLWITGDTKC